MNVAVILPILIGFPLDALLGDPQALPHPVRVIGAMISRLENLVRALFSNLRWGGFWIVAVVSLTSAAVPCAILVICYLVSTVLGIAVESIFCYYLLAARCLRDESTKVYKALERNDLSGAKKAVSGIVGRDTENLDEQGVLRATVETVAENTTDGVTSPLFYMMFGGAVGGFFFKAANTMDSMLGYKNAKYREIGFFAAKLDDILGILPSRLTALLSVPATFLCGQDGKNACRIWKRDRLRHESPNAAQTESAFAGALHIQLGGDATYFGELHKKPEIGDTDRPLQNSDIRKSNAMMYVTSILMLLIACAVRGLLL